jgi:hypothetical protein
LRNGFVLIVAVFALLAVTGQYRVMAQVQRACKGEQSIRTGGVAKTEFLARKRARDAWRQKVEETIGKEWSAWYLAKDHSYRCFYDIGNRRCTAKAVPCRSTVVIHGPRKICNFYQIDATGVSAQIEEWARHNARLAWAQRVRMLLGKDFDTWLLANNRRVECKNYNIGRRYCKATATPCRFVLFD